MSLGLGRGGGGGEPLVIDDGRTLQLMEEELIRKNGGWGQNPMAVPWSQRAIITNYSKPEGHC